MTGFTTLAQAMPTAVADPDRPAVVSEYGETVTYGEFGRNVGALAGALRERGLQVGDAVAVMCDNSAAFLEMTWACRLAGLYFVPVNTHLGPDEIAYIVDDSGAAAVLASANVPAVLRLSQAAAPKVRHWLLRGGDLPGWDSYEATLRAAPAYEPDTDLEGDMLQYSSGTTGRPKGIKRPLRPAPKSPAEDPTTFLPALIGADASAIYLCPAPLYHSAPIMWCMALTRIGATIVLMQKFEAVRALQLIQEHGVTHGQFVPTMFARMLKLPEDERLSFDVSSLRGVVHAAAPCPVDIKRRMIEWWGPIVSEYWSSSEGAGFTFITAAEWLEHPGSVGRSLIGTLHILDEDGTELPPGREGVIWHEGTGFTYLNDPDKDAQTTSRQGWRTVGDIGRFDDDGYLYLTDRQSFMIISGGVNIYPQESENVLVEHPRVMDAAVVGLPDADLGEIAVAVVQPVDPRDATDEFAAELLAWSQERLARYKVPRRLVFTDELPRSDAGKLYKRRLREQLIEAASA